MTLPFSGRGHGPRAPCRPLVWALTGSRTGDNRQVLGLAKALGWPWTEKRLAYNGLYRVPNLCLGASLASLDPSLSSPLEPPWPDVVVAVGRRSVPVARWIRRQSGGSAVLVHLGHSRAPARIFDLVIATPQYGVAPAPNVVENRLPLTDVSDAALRRAAGEWKDLVARLPRPRLAVLVGGDSRPFRFDAPAAERLTRHVNALLRREGGSVLVTTSGRTDPDAASVLEAGIAPPCYVHRWDRSGPDNPYLGILAHADRLIVTGDSASMLADACATRRAVSLVRLDRPPPSALESAARRGYPGINALMRAGIVSRPRDLARFWDRLTPRGAAGDVVPVDPVDPALQMERAVAAVRAWVALRQSPTSDEPSRADSAYGIVG